MYIPRHFDTKELVDEETFNLLGENAIKLFDEDLLIDVGWSGEEIDEIFGLERAEDYDAEKEFQKVLAGKGRRCKEGDLFGMGEYYICPNCKKEIDEKEMLDM